MTTSGAKGSGMRKNDQESPSEPGSATSPDAEKPERSDTGVTLGAGEPNTFEPEEAAPAPETPTE